MSSNILSFTMSGHGFSGVLVIDGEVKIATSLERLTRIKNDILLPISKNDLKTFGWNSNPAIYEKNVDLPFDLQNDYSTVDFSKSANFLKLLNYLLDSQNLTIDDIDYVAYSYRYNESMKQFFYNQNPNIKFVELEHHFGHACQAFLPSGFEDAAIMVVDGQGVPLKRTGGDQLSGCLAYGQGNQIDTFYDLPVRHSLGGMYAAFTKKVGFKTNEEGKTMGLAPYGSPRYYDILKKDLIFNTTEYSIKDFKQLVKRGFSKREVLYQLPDYNKFLKSFPTRLKSEEITDVHRDLAYAVQKLTEDVMIFLANWLYEKTGSKNLCIAGGVGLNCVANYQVLIHSKFDNIFIHPNSGDNGLAVGQALYVHNVLNNNPRTYVATTDSLGKEYTDDDIKEAINKYSNDEDLEIIHYTNLDELYDTFASYIEQGYITSWFQGRSEFGPRALGNRSIIADPRRKDMKDILNSRVKFRESFRPFTPSVLAEKVNEFFELEIDSPFMLLAAYVRKGKAELVPAITHEDNTARIQTVTEDINPPYYHLIKAFYKRTGIPLILETSFNIADEPIVETPSDAIRTFKSTDIDILCLKDYIIKKKSKGI
ncbi:carbamoyltransferase C-terminal domain-containing protein [Sulfurimonas sp. HSL-1716]|uniref:carbamoyltransferase family protein n=1 Tax=Hydrocurvibacter sulfurireducens TaxID=3131937 RepID=UPI0031F98A2D